MRGTTMHRRCIAERSADKYGCAGHLRNTGCFIQFASICKADYCEDGSGRQRCRNDQRHRQ